MGRLLTRITKRKVVAVLAGVSAVAVTAVAISTGLAASGTDTITTIAGTGVAGFSGDTGQGTAAQLRFPRGVAVDSAGNVYIADADNHRIRKVTPGGVITTFAGTGVAGFSGDTGQATAAQLSTPYGVAVDAAGNVYIADLLNQRIRKVDPSGVITTYAGTGVAGFSGDTGQATAAQISFPYGVAVDTAGNVYIAALGNQRVRKVDPTGIITTFAGTGVPGFSGDTGQATAARLSSPVGVGADAAGNVYIADAVNNRVRKVDPTGIITTFAGTGVPGFAGDTGQATLAQLKVPTGVAVDAAGNVYIADRENSRVRRVDPSGVITTLAGTGAFGFSGDTGQANLAQVAVPWGVATDAAGNVYIGDNGNHRVRKVATVPPTASFTANPASGPVPLTVNFNGSASTHPGGAITAYAWDFGDGQAGAGAQTSHTYNAVGTYTVVLTVTAQSGGQASVSQVITVTEPPPPPIMCGGLQATIIGTAGPNQLVGTPGADVIHGLGGGDTITAFSGADVVCGGGGNDVIRGGAGPDRLLGGSGADRLFGEGGPDILTGGAGRDTANGGPGNDSCAAEIRVNC
jgi:sugar lactone lactonase YvrE